MYTCILHEVFIYVTQLIYTCDMTHRHVWHDSQVLSHHITASHTHTHTHTITRTHTHSHTHIVRCVTWHMKESFMCGMTDLYVWHDSQIPSQHMTSFSDVWHKSYIYVICLIYVCGMTHNFRTNIWHHFPMCKMTVSYVWLDWSICLTWLINCEQTCNLIAFSYVLYGFFMCKCDSKALLTLPACTFRASPWGPWPLQCWAACILFNANWWGAKYRVSEQRDEHGRSGDFREWKFIIEHLIYKQFCWARAGFTTLHGLVPISTLVPQIYIAFAPRTKGRL